jgi:DNA-binding beta-propeller fold protein YncE
VGNFGSGNGQFSGPSGIVIDSSSGHVFVTDRGNNHIQIFTKDGQFVRVISFGPIIEL